jgi:hypothetical protein
MGFQWLSGTIWLYLDQAAAGRDPFDGAPSPWAPPLLTSHGVVAVAAMYLFGWITSHHVLRWWSRGRRRLSGGTLASLLVLLTVSGFTLFFVSDDRWQHYASVVHDILGLIAPVMAVQHWFFVRRVRISATPPA